LIMAFFMQKQKERCHAEALEACGQRPLRSPFDGAQGDPILILDLMFFAFSVLTHSGRGIPKLLRCDPL
jgi:hypothetical protein